MSPTLGPRQVSSHEEKLSLKKVMDLVNRGSDHAQQTQDMNKKLQGMLEETLTKNMHLQQVRAAGVWLLFVVFMIHRVLFHLFFFYVSISVCSGFM